ncbi:helix-turn-helix domain-containing protein [Subtercola boreus]|uniref:HTH araC/xylS-type domain-containing protein n=1 Tax=Subtercola boreus TaxID=120213 RepID=A0A3E0WD74_9MICO|nr:AraC family transcriptional regulator [Subtercola boreus]RFA22760.1 hypothetical protein B7R24_03925 [Subtercola boreus]RFA23115.1 hypothetical protein B7R23_03920 [Subtercola boreus]RFA28868.1 hypothetical protein B7R25_03935 [Subtercola boreus]
MPEVNDSQLEFSTTMPVELSGPEGLASLGPSVQAQDAPEFAVRGTRCTFGRSTIADLTLTSFDHDAAIGVPVGFPNPASLSLVFVVEGMAEVVTEGSRYFYTAGSAAVQPAHTTPRVICRQSTRLLSVSFDAGSSDFDGMLPERFTAISASVVRTHPAVPFFLALATVMKTHPIRTEPAATILTRLVAGLLSADQDWHTRPDRPVLSHILDLIAEHHTDPSFDRKSLARQNKTTARALDEMLQQTGWKTAEELITERRLITAVPLLRPGTLPEVESIAERCGFPSREAFETIVERVYGVNASALLTLNQP